MNREELFSWCESHADEQIELLKTLASVPSPSHHEGKRVEFIVNWLENIGAKNVTVDPAQNVLLPFGDTSRPAYVYAAHTDVVFPDTEPFTVKEENGRLYAPGVGDDTANVVALMLIAKFLISGRFNPVEPVLFVFNTCEEGLGNLKGMRQLFADRKGLIREFVSFDAGYKEIVNRAVGSERWRIKVATCGGHSYSAFGNPNAIAHMAKLIALLDAQPVPKMEGRRTTYNFGVISGGTSVNAIAQDVEMLYEYRSDELSHLAQMRAQLNAALSECECADAHFSHEVVGERPCGEEIDAPLAEKLFRRCATAISSVTGEEPTSRAASTDANIPLSLGVPAVTFGLYLGEKEHTREESLEIASLQPGLKIGLSLVADHFKK